MENTLTFNELLEAANKLPLEDHETLIDILNRRIADDRRKEIKKAIESAQEEFRANGCSPATSDELMLEILSSR